MYVGKCRHCTRQLSSRYSTSEGWHSSRRRGFMSSLVIMKSPWMKSILGGCVMLWQVFLSFTRYKQIVFCTDCPSLKLLSHESHFFSSSLHTCWECGGYFEWSFQDCVTLFCHKPHLSTPLNKERLQVRYKWTAHSCEWTIYRTGQKPNLPGIMLWEVFFLGLLIIALLYCTRKR